MPGDDPESEWETLLAELEPAPPSADAERIRLESMPDPDAIEGEVTQPGPPGTPAVLTPEINPFQLTHTELQFAFAQAHWDNLAKAAEFAGLNGRSSSGRKMLDKPHVAAEVARLKAEMAKLPALPEATDQAETRAVMHAIVHAELTDAWLIDKDGVATLKAVKDMPAGLRKAIKRITVRKGGIVDIELYDKIAAARVLEGRTTMRRFTVPIGGESVPLEGGVEGEILPPSTPAPAGARAITYEEFVSGNGDEIRNTILRTGR